MNVLLVIHGYPRRYNAGSEIYTQTLAHALAKQDVNVSIFTREEDPFLPDYHLRLEADPMMPQIPVHIMNHARSNARFQNDKVDNAFLSVIEAVQPDIVHFGHLNHLSMGMPKIAKKQGASTLFTLHDFWLMCPRGQFLEWGLTPEEPWKLCTGQDDRKCASRCFNRFIGGTHVEQELDHWESWVNQRMIASREASSEIDLFLAPSKNIMIRHIEEYGIQPEKIQFLDYGFDAERLQNRQRTREEPFVFGYIGRHHPSKGIHNLIEAFSRLKGNSLLRIWGRPQGQLTQSLQRRVGQLGDLNSRIEWLPEYNNEEIVRDVFNQCDCIVVPSIWDENSPLVIHEAQECAVPVITAHHGGMGEYVKDGINGFTFEHRSVDGLTDAMQKAIDHPERIESLGLRGYLLSDDGRIPNQSEHANAVLHEYTRLDQKRREEI